MKPENSWSVALLCCALLCAGCAASSAGADVAGPRPAAAARLSPDCLAMPVAEDATDYRIRPGDKLHITFYLNPEFDADAVVRPDGKIEMAAVGQVTAAGITPPQLEAQLNRLYSKELLHPGATVRVDETPSRVVYVEGQVAHPGTITLQPGMTALQAIAASGGLTDEAAPHNVVLVRRDACGDPHDEKLDLHKALKKQDHRDDVVLAPTDLLVVPRSGIANVDLFVKQYIKDVMPINPYLTLPVF